jgi:hypothetical protein
MKRRITVEQLQELTEEQQQRLREWWEPKEYDIAMLQNRVSCIEGLSQLTEGYVIELAVPVDAEGDEYIYAGQFGYRKEDCLPLLDIGQMIELLDNKQCDINYNQDCTIPVCELLVDGKGYRHKELCDALWQAVKQVL